MTMPRTAPAARVVNRAKRRYAGMYSSSSFHAEVCPRRAAISLLLPATRPVRKLQFPAISSGSPTRGYARCRRSRAPTLLRGVVDFGETSSVAISRAARSGRLYQNPQTCSDSVVPETGDAQPWLHGRHRGMGTRVAAWWGMEVEVRTPLFTPSPFAGTSYADDRHRYVRLPAASWPVLLALGLATLLAMIAAPFLS